jgi:hypothetical protein
MKRVKFNTLEIRRNESTTVRTTVPAWEVPLLQALHGQMNVNILGTEVRNAEVPDAETEFQRLEGRYGRTRQEDGSVGMPYAQAVFGQFMPGIMALERMIDAATVREPVAA